MQGRVAGAISYLFEYASEQNPDDWKSVPSTRVKYVFKGLKIRTLYYFRIAAVGANNQIAYSDIIDRTAT